MDAKHPTQARKVNSETIQHFFTELRAHNGSNKRIHLNLDGAELMLLKIKRISLILNFIIFRLTAQI